MAYVPPILVTLCSSSANISRVVITDSDDNNEFPDSNLGYDTFRFGKTDSSGTPEPATWGSAPRA